MKKTLLVLFVSSVFVGGCGPAYKPDYKKEARAKGWTEDQVEAAHYISYRWYFALEDEKNNGHYLVNYARLPKTRVREKLDSVIQDIDDILSYRNTWAVNYVEHFDLRADLERQEKVLKSVRARVRGSELYDQFKQLTGVGSGRCCEGGSDYGGGYSPYRSSYGGYESDYENDKKELESGYDFRIYLNQDLSKIFNFTMDKVTNAKERDILNKVEDGSLFVRRKFDHKKPDPKNLNDPNQYVWVPLALTLELDFYKIVDVERPQDNRPDYLEGFRAVGGKREAYPCLRVFFVNSDSRGVLVVDTDREGQPGFGFPDYVEMTYHIDSSRNIFSNDQLLSVIFPEDKNQYERKKPKEKPLYIEIARVGSPVNLWEDAPNEKGWLVPFRYRDEHGRAYNIKLEFEKVEPKKGSINFTRKLKSINKEWTAGGRYQPSVGMVVECYKPKAPYDKELVSAQVLHMEDTKKVKFVFVDGTEETGTVLPAVNGSNSKYIEDSPYAIEYSEGEKRWHIEKMDDAKVFNKRKQVVLVHGETGFYKKE